jgi:DNA-binding transcriptional ArsR family regulator
MQEAIDAIAHPGRRALLQLVLDRELPVGELAARTGLTQPAASQHLKVLRDAGLVRGRVDGRRRLYRVDLEGLERLRRELDAWRGRPRSRSRTTPRPATGREARVLRAHDRGPGRGGLGAPHHGRGAHALGRPGRHRWACRPGARPSRSTSSSGTARPPSGWSTTACPPRSCPTTSTAGPTSWGSCGPPWPPAEPDTPAGGSGAPQRGPCLARQTPADRPRQASPAGNRLVRGSPWRGLGQGHPPL